MIIDRNWNKYDQRLTISYVDKTGRRQLFSKYLHHIKSYEYDENGKYDTWNGKKANKIFKDSSKYSPNEFDILELLYEMKNSGDSQVYRDLTSIYESRLYSYDIETETDNINFPDPNTAPQRVTAISLVGPDLSCMVLGLHSLSKDQIELLRQRYLDWIRDNHFAKHLCDLRKFEPKFYYVGFNQDEKALLEHWFCKILPNIGEIAGWNNWRFDKKYLCNRLKKLFGDREANNMIKKASPTFEMTKISWGEMDGSKDFTYRAVHQAELDYMELCKKYDFVLRPYESYSLDWVGSHAVDAHKIKYEGTIQQLWERDPEWYYFYNAVDSLIVNLIHYRLRCLDPLVATSSLTLVPMIKALGQVAVTTAGVFDMFYRDGKHVVYDLNEIDRTKIPYEGAFCGCVPGRFEYTVCDDFASLYPSQIITCNLSMENIVTKYSEPDSLGRTVPIPWTEEELDTFKQDPNYFVSVMGTVYKNDKDYCFRKYQAEKKSQRNKLKYLGWDIDGELISKVEELIKLKEQEEEAA